MKVIIFGSTGKIGSHVLGQALDLGHEVTAYVRDPRKLQARHKNLSVVQGDVLDSGSVRQAIEGHEAVVCTLGMPLMNKDGLRAKGTKIIIDAMEEVGVKRIICLSGLGAGDSRAILPFHYKYIIFPLMLHHVYADHEDQETHIQNSDLDWVIVRPGNFSKGKHTGHYRHGFESADKSLKLKISHADVADFMLWQLDDDTYLHQAPALSY